MKERPTDVDIKNFLNEHKTGITVTAAATAAVTLTALWLLYKKYHARPESEGIQQTINELDSMCDENALVLHTEKLIAEVGSDDVVTAAQQLSEAVEANQELNPMVADKHERIHFSDMFMRVAAFAGIRSQNK